MEKIEIKTENRGLNCVICLRNDSQLFGEHEIKAEVLELYKDLLKSFVSLSCFEYFLQVSIVSFHFSMSFWMK